MPTASLDSLGARVKSLRLERGWSQTDLARDLVSTSYISLIEADRRLPERRVLEALATRLGCPIGYLESGQDPATRHETELHLRFAELALANGDLLEAGARFEELAQSTSGADRSRAIWGLVRVQEAHGDLDAALTQVESLIEGVGRGEDAGPGLTLLLMCQCRLYREVGDLARSVEVGQAALAQIRELGLAGTDEEVRLASTVVMSYWERGDYFTAKRLAEEVIARAEACATPRARGAAYWNASLVCEANGDLQRAVELAGRALALFSEQNSERDLPRLRTDFAWILLRIDPPDVERAEALLRRSHEVLTAANDLAYCETELARCRLHQGRPDEAAQLAECALARLSDQASAELGRARLVLGQAMLMRGLVEEGLRECRRAADHLRAVGAPRQAVGVWREIADTLVALGRPDEALEAYRSLADSAGATRVPQPQPLTAPSR